MISPSIMPEKVTIIGAGWLGKPLATALLEDGFDVVTTHRSVPKNQAHHQSHKTACDSPDKKRIMTLEYSDFLLQKMMHAKPLSKTEAASDSYGEYTYLCQQLFAGRKVIITIPPSHFIKGTQTISGDFLQSPFTYAEMILYTAQLAQSFNASEIIFTSSTSVYGNSSGIIHEALPAMPKTENAKAIRQAEIAIESHINIPVMIVRLAGLIGNGRHPIYHLSGKENIKEPLNAINLLHIDDLICALKALLLRQKKDSAFEILNIVTPYHPNRVSYYQSLAKIMALPQPLFEDPKPLLKKIIDGQKITEKKDFNYKVIDLLHAPLNALI